MFCKTNSGQRGADRTNMQLNCILLKFYKRYRQELFLGEGALEICPVQLHDCPAGRAVTEIMFVEEKMKHSFKTKTMKSKMKWIASLKIWVVIYPSITFFLYIFGESLSVLPLYQRTFLITITLVPWIVFAGVPFVDTLVRRIMVRNRNFKH
jgi:hypothetical protein